MSCSRNPDIFSQSKDKKQKNERSLNNSHNKLDRNGWNGMPEMTQIYLFIYLVLRQQLLACESDDLIAPWIDEKAIK